MELEEHFEVTIPDEAVPPPAHGSLATPVSPP
jgi:hypothetical protein